MVDVYENVIYLGAVEKIVQSSFPDFTLCEPIRVSGQWIPMFFIVETRDMIGVPPDTMRHLVSIMRTEKAVQPVFLFRLGDAIYDWWLEYYDPTGNAKIILDALIEVNKAPVAFIMKKENEIREVRLYDIENNWRKTLMDVKKLISSIPRWEMRDAMNVKVSTILSFGTRENLWKSITSKKDA